MTTQIAAKILFQQMLPIYVSPQRVAFISLPAVWAQNPEINKKKLKFSKIQ